MAASGTSDPLLLRRIEGEARHIARVQNGLAKRTYLLPFAADPIIGIERLKSLSLCAGLRFGRCRANHLELQAQVCAGSALPGHPSVR